nr:MAG TPA: hypothetical protein [Caudoviricetes sp.]
MLNPKKNEFLGFFYFYNLLPLPKFKFRAGWYNQYRSINQWTEAK